MQKLEWILALLGIALITSSPCYGDQGAMTYGGTDTDRAGGLRSIQLTTDGGYILAGGTQSFGPSTAVSAHILKLKSEGTVDSQKTYGGSENERFYSMKQTSDCGYMVSGRTRSFGAGDIDMFILKLDGDGEIPGCNLMGTSNAVVGNRSVVVKDPNVIVQTLSAIDVDTEVSAMDTLADQLVICCFPETVKISLDIKPGPCPNPLNTRSKGVLPVAILGTENFEVYVIDVATIMLEGVSPIRSGYEDVATAFDGDPCDCHEFGPDGFHDLTLKFHTQEIVAALGPVSEGDEVVTTITGSLLDGSPIEGQDCIVVISESEDGGEEEE